MERRPSPLGEKKLSSDKRLKKPLFRLGLRWLSGPKLSDLFFGGESLESLQFAGSSSSVDEELSYSVCAFSDVSFSVYCLR